MIRRLAARLARMDGPEIAWRATTAARTSIERASARLLPTAWNRGHLLGALSQDAGLGPARLALSDRRWEDAHCELARRFANAPRRFVIGQSDKDAVVARIAADFPGAAREAAARADRILAGQYDLLGYRGLRFDQPAPLDPSAPLDPLDLSDPSDPLVPPALPAFPALPALIDWHFDPVHRRRAPLAFWSDVPYLAPECGDHKIVWELNRHQHWIALGRAFWLTGDVRYRDRFVAELAGWIDHNPPLMGINWASMLELAFRSLSWLWAIHFFADDRPHEEITSPWLVDLLMALDRQLTHVERNLSYYFSPNTHLLGEALALYVAGRTLPELAASPRRATIGRDILLAEIDRQIGADGGHCERSTHYHRYALDFYALALTVARITGDGAAASRFERAVAALGSAARLLAADNGRLPHIGDDDGGVLLPMTGRDADDLRDSLAVASVLVGRPDFQVGAAPEEAVWMLGSSVEFPVHSPQPRASGALPDTGYFVSRSPSGPHLVIDGGPHGYKNGGHAHADALSLTCSLGGVPLLIDPGTGCYTTDPALRDRLRSSALHNTLTLDDRPQSVPNGPFHWSHVANSRVRAWRTNARFDYFDGGHDGYRPVEHRRRVLALHGDLVVVADLVSSALPPAAHSAALHWHFDPRWTIEARGRRAVLRRADDPNVRVGLAVPQGLLEHFDGDANTGLGWHSPVYGRLERTTTVRVSHSGSAPFWTVSVFDFDPDNPVAEVDSVPVWAEAGVVAHATAIRITRAASVDHVLFAAPSHEGNERLTGENAEYAEKKTFSAISASSAVKRDSWRVGEFETDARMLYCRTTLDHPVARLAMVDGSMVRVAGRRDFQLALPRSIPAFAADYTTPGGERWTMDQERRTKD